MAALTSAVQDSLGEALSQSEDVSTIVNIAATAEAMAVSLLGAAIKNAANYGGVPNQSGPGIPAPIMTILKAAQCSEQDHYTYLTGAGGKALTLTFNIPDPKIGTDYMTLFKTIESLETAFISAYEAAAKEFAQMGKSDLVKVALQIGAVEGEHRALARLALGDALPHNLAFSEAQFSTVGAAANALKSLGFIGGTGTAINYNDFAGSVDCTGVTENTPGGVSASIGPASAAAPSPAQTPPSVGQIPAQMPTTGGGGMANRSGLSLWPVLAAGGLVAAGIGLRQRRSARER